VGFEGESEVGVPSPIGRELRFLSTQRVHHFALLGKFGKSVGVDLGTTPSGPLAVPSLPFEP
jgi:hypothetical protein